MGTMDTYILKFFDEPGNVIAGAVGLFVLLLAFVYRREVHFNLRFVARSLYHNRLRTLLTALATMVLVLVITLVWSVFAMLDRATSEKTRDFKVIATERWQIPSQMPYAYASSLENGAATEAGDHRVNPADDAMTWQFVGGTLDPTKRTFENMVFFFGMEPNKLLKMMDDMDQFTQEQRAQIDQACQDMEKDPRKVIIGIDRLKMMKKQVGDRFKLTSFNYKDLEFEVEVIGAFPSGRWGQSGLMNREYLNRTLDDYERKRGTKHPMAEKTLNLVWLRVPDNAAFQKVAEQIETRGLFTSPSVKCETASSGIASFLDAYRDLLWGMRWLLIPAALVTMALVIANAISISVRERRTEMAVLKVLGYRPGQIMVLVLAEAVLIGSVSGLLSAAGTWLLFNKTFGGVPFPIAFFSIIPISDHAWWWGFVIGGGTALVGSLLPAWSARSVRVAEVFSKIS